MTKTPTVPTSQDDDSLLTSIDSDHLLCRIIHGCPIPITVSRLSDEVVLFESSAVSELYKHGHSRVGRTGLSRWADVEDRGRFLAALNRDKVVDDMQVRMRKDNDEVFWCSLSARVIHYRDEELAVITTLDLTETRHAAEELERHRAMLAQSEKVSAFGELLAGISHELNNPLYVLAGQALMLKEKAPDEATRQRAERISKAVDRCSRIVKSFLALAHQNPNAPMPVSLNEIVEEALELTVHGLRTSSIDVSLKLDNKLPDVVADPDQLRQVFTNLITNARHALESVERKRSLLIRTSYRRSGNRAVFKITDNGVGVAPEIASRIFEPLFTTKEVGKGTGIGLSLSHRIIQAHKGTMKLEDSIPGRTTFSIGLPCVDAKDKAELNRRWARRGTDTLDILVVAEEPSVGEKLANIAVTDGHGVEFFESVYSGLERLKQRRFGAVFFDCRFSGLDVPELLRALETARPGSVDRLVFIVPKSIDRRAIDRLEATGRPFVEVPLMPKAVAELLDLLQRR